MKIKGFIYYGFGALLGAFFGFAIGLCYITVDERFSEYPWAYTLLIPVSLLVVPVIRDEFMMVNNQRATIFTFMMFVSALVSIITTLHFMGGAS